MLLSSMDAEADATGLSQRSGLRQALRDAAGGARRRPLEGLAAAARHLPADAARLPRRLHARRDGLRPGDRAAARAGAAPPCGKALPQGAGARRPRRRRAAAAYGDDGDDLMLALARKIVAGEAGEESVEDVFAQAQQVAADAEALLVDAEWAAPEPVAAEVVAVEAGADAGRDDAPEPQRTLFSWAEFMAEDQVEPRPRRRDEAPTLSLFEWALDRGARGGTGRRGALDRSTQGEATAHPAVASLRPPMCVAFSAFRPRADDGAPPSSVPGAPTRPWPAGSIAAAEGSRLNSGSGSFFVSRWRPDPGRGGGWGPT